MAMNNYNSAIIGLDAQFTNQGVFQQDIDRVERALYLGVEKEKPDGQLNEVGAEVTLIDCQQAVARMASANQVNSTDIKVVLISQNADIDATSFVAANS